LSALTHLVHHSKHLCIKVGLSTQIFLDLRNTGVPNDLSIFTLASAEKTMKIKLNLFTQANKCTKSSDAISTKMYLHEPYKGRNKGSVDFCALFERRLAKLLLEIRQACYVVGREGQGCEKQIKRTSWDAKGGIFQ
jgi:hypothetical protein